MIFELEGNINITPSTPTFTIHKTACIIVDHQKEKKFQSIILKLTSTIPQTGVTESSNHFHFHLNSGADEPLG